MGWIALGIKLQDSRFCVDCPCLRCDDFYGYPESCNLDYAIKIKYYNSALDEYRDTLGIRKYSGYPYGFSKVAIRPESCIRENDLDIEELRKLLRNTLCAVGHLNVIDEDVVDDLVERDTSCIGL